MATGYVNIKGRGLKFCQGSIADLQKKISSMPAEKVEAWGGYWLAHYGLEANCIIKGDDINFTFGDTVEWMESLTSEEILQIKAAYDATQDFIKDIPEKSKKKNQQKTKKTTGMSV